MENIDIDMSGIDAVLGGEDSRLMMETVGELAREIYVGIAPHDTGHLVSTAHSDPYKDLGRWHGRMIVTASYAASVEFGVDTTHPGPIRIAGFIKGAQHNLNQVLNLLGEL